MEQFIVQHLKVIFTLIIAAAGAYFVIREQLVSKLTAAFHNAVVTVEAKLGHVVGATVPPPPAMQIIPSATKQVILKTVVLAVPTTGTLVWAPTVRGADILKTFPQGAQEAAESLRQLAAAALSFTADGQVNAQTIKFNTAAIHTADDLAAFKREYGLL